MPCFLFCVGFSFRITSPKRLRARGGSLMAATWDLVSTRCIGLIILQVFTDRDIDEYSSWVQVQEDGLGGWLLHVARSPYLYDTLTQISFTSLWTFWAFASLSSCARVALLVFSLVLQLVVFASFYWDWVIEYGLDQGGYLGFLGWTLAFIVGSFVHDATAAASDGRLDAQESDAEVQAVPCGLTRRFGCTAAGAHYCTWPRSPARLACYLTACGTSLATLGYVLSCLSVAAPIAPCYENVYRDSARVPCAPPGSRFWVTPPLVQPSSPPIATMWSVSDAVICTLTGGSAWRATTKSPPLTDEPSQREPALPPLHARRRNAPLHILLPCL